MMRNSLWLVPAGAALAAGLALTSTTTVSAQAAAATPEFYTRSVQPILQANCYRCHAGMNRRGGLQLDSRHAMLEGGHDGPAIVPGHPESSLLVKLIRHEGPPGDPMPMPPRSKLSDADIATITAWIQAGAIMPPDSSAH